MDIRLITQARNPFSEKVARALALKKLEHETVVVSDPAEIKRWNPQAGRLPVLEIGAERRHESAEIIAWIDELFPEPPLLSRDPKVADAQQSLAAWSDSSFSFYWDRWRSARFPQPGDENPADQGLLDRVRQSLERTLRLPGTPSQGELRELQVIEGISNRLDDLVGFLGEREFFHSTEPSIADLAVLGMLTIIRDGPIPGSRELMNARPVLITYMERLEALTGGARKRDEDD